MTVINEIESKPLASDPRKKEINSSDDYFDLIYKLKDSNRSGFQNKNKNDVNDNNDENDDENQDEDKDQ